MVSLTEFYDHWLTGSSGIQRAMVKSMNAAWNVPHFVYCDEVVMDNLMQLRTELKDLAASKGVKFSYLPLILKVG